MTPEITQLTLSQLRRAALVISGGMELKVTVPACMESTARDLPGFVPAIQYQSVEWLVRKLMLGEDLINTKTKYKNEIGRSERFIFVLDFEQRPTNTEVWHVTVSNETGLVVLDVRPSELA